MTTSKTRIERIALPCDHGSIRLDQLISTLDGVASRSQAVHIIENGQVSVNGSIETSKKRIVKGGDEISVNMIEQSEDQSTTIVGQRIPLDIRFEDDHLIVLSKQKGLVCHPAPGHPDHTLVNALVYHCGLEHLGRLQGDDRPGIVHRLDQDTTGLMLAAKDDETQAALQDMIRLRTLDRRYITLVQGYVAPDTGLVDAAIARSTKDRLKMAVSEDPSARQAITTFSVLARYEAGQHDDGYTLLECHLYTGRTHQIRVHMAYINHPVVGDQLYGRGTQTRNLGLDRQFLHSWSLVFKHPITEERLSFIDSPTYELQDALESIEDRLIARTPRGDEVFDLLHQSDTLKEHAAWGGWQ